MEELIMPDLFTTWFGQLALLAAVTVILLVIRRLLGRFWPRRLNVLDFWPPLLLIFTHFLTLQATESSLLPYEIISLMIFGIGLTVLEVIQRGEILYWRFFKLYWRLCDLVTIVVYIAALGLALLS